VLTQQQQQQLQQQQGWVDMALVPALLLDLPHLSGSKGTYRQQQRQQLAAATE
jgi:hypothetical protein